MTVSVRVEPLAGVEVSATRIDLAVGGSVSITGGPGGVVGPASATDGAVAKFDGTTGKLLKDGGVLGTAATVDTGTGSGNAILGNDSRLTDARTPTSHKTSHATGGGDALTASDIGAQPVDSDLTTIASLTATTDSFIQSKGSAWSARTVAQVQSDLGVQHVLSTPIGSWTGPVSNTTAEATQTDLYLGAGGRGSASLVRLAAGTYDRVAIGVSAAGTATLRLGLWAADRTTGMPGSLVLDAGTVSTSGSAGIREITISSALAGGWYWCSVSTDAYTSGFSLWSIVDNISSPVHGMPCSGTDARMRTRNSFTSSSFGTSGLPGTFPTIFSDYAAGPKLIFRRSA